MGNLIYLSPPQVEELRELGVEFEESYMMTIIRNESTQYNTAINRRMAECFYDDVMYCEKNWKDNFVPAPSLSELLDKLPKTIPDSDDLTFYGITLTFDERGKWLASYRNGYDMYITGSLFYNINPLLAMFELLKWVAKNYPESLTK